MKVAILSIFLVVLVAQAQISHGSPLLSFGTNLVTGVVNVVNNTVNTVFNTVVTLYNQTLNTIITSVTNALAKAKTDISNTINAANELASNVEDILANSTATLSDIADDVLTNAANVSSQLLQNTNTAIEKLNATIRNSLSTTESLLSNPINIINNAIADFAADLKNLNLLDTLKNIILNVGGRVASLIDDSVDLAQEIRDQFKNQVASADSLFIDTATEIANETKSVLNALNTTANVFETLLKQAGNLSDALAAQVATGVQSITNPVYSLSSTVINNAFNAVRATVNSIPALLSNGIATLQNTTDSIGSTFNSTFQDITTELAGIVGACTNDVLNAASSLAQDATSEAASCVTNEAATLSKYLTQFQNLAAQYQSSLASQTINVSTLQQTVQLSFDFKLYLASLKVKLETCLAIKLVTSASKVLPVAQTFLTCASN